MDEELKKRIESLCQPVKDDDMTPSIDDDDDLDLLNKYTQTMEKFNSLLPKLQQLIQQQEMDATLNISTLSFLNDSFDRSIANNNKINNEKYFAISYDYETIATMLSGLCNFNEAQIDQLMKNGEKQMFTRMNKKLEYYLKMLNSKFE